MAQPAILTLGDISFLQREIPDTINFGGKQMMAVHKNLGGFRTIDAMGPDPADIHWAGHFYTIAGIPGTAAERARAVDTLRQSGTEVTLTWGSFSYQVIVADFEAVYKHEWQISYRIVCKVVADNGVQPFNASNLAPSLNSVVNEDIAAIMALANSGAVIPSSATAALVGAQSTMASIVGAGTLDDLSLTQLQPIIAAFQNAYAAFGAGSGTPIGINLDAITGASTLDGVATFVTEANAVAAESDMETATAYLGRIIANLTDTGG